MTSTPSGPGPGSNDPSAYPGPTPPPGQHGGQPSQGGWAPYPTGGQQPPSEPVARPASMTWAVRLLVLGAVISLAGTVVGLFTAGGERDQVRDQIEGQGTEASPEMVDAAFAFGLGAAVVIGVLSAAAWLWMAWKNGQGRSWARVLATILGGINLLFTGVGFLLPNAGLGVSDVVLSVLTVVVGVAILVLLWRPSSSRFYAETSARTAH